jgi:hypothetical protein
MLRGCLASIVVLTSVPACDGTLASACLQLRSRLHGTDFLNRYCGAFRNFLLLGWSPQASKSPLLQGVPFPEARVRALFQQLITAVDYSHRLGVVSRDIKLDNMLLR